MHRNYEDSLRGAKMKKIKKYVDMIKDEIESAEEYAEKYVESKAMGETSYAEKYKLFAQQELDHAMFVHNLAEVFIDKVSKVITPPADMKEKWESAHIECVSKVDEIKAMIAK